MTLSDAKDQIAVRHDFENWLHLVRVGFINESLTEETYDHLALYEEEAAELYAKHKAMEFLLWSSNKTTELKDGYWVNPNRTGEPPVRPEELYNTFNNK